MDKKIGIARKRNSLIKPISLKQFYVNKKELGGEKRQLHDKCAHDTMSFI